MAKKGQAVQLQQELNNDEDWEKMLQRSGLIVVDIYSEWCGPCSAMVANLKKLKLEVGGDNLQLAIAKADGITCLERFRSKSEPTWMFIAGGKMVNLTFGANAPKLTRLIVEELKKEAAVKAGTAQRQTKEISELSSEEQIRFDKKKAIEDEALRIEIEKKNEIIHERRTAVANVVLDNVALTGVIVVFPHAKDTVQATLAELWDPAELSVAATEKVVFSEEVIEELLYFADFQFNEIDTQTLLSAPCLAYLVKPSSPDEFSGDIDKTILQFVYGDSKCPPGSPESPAQLLMGYVALPKEVAQSATALRSKDTSATAAVEEDLAIPSILSLSALQVPSSPSILSNTKIMSKTEMESRTEMRSKMTLTSKTSVKEKSTSRSTHKSEESEEETIPVTGLWAPPNSFTKATAIKILFPKVYEPIALPEPVPIPPHVAIAFEAFKRKEVFDLMAEYPDEIMRFGFFTDDNPEEAKLVAKTVHKFEKAYAASATHDEKLVIQLSKKRSEALCAFSQIGPSFMSHNTVDGEQECKLFFPENYDIPEEEEEEVKEVKKGKKGKKGKKSKEAASVHEETVEEVPLDEAALEEEPEELGEGEGDEEIEGEGLGADAEGEEGTGEPILPEEADKATSPMPEENPPAAE